MKTGKKTVPKYALDEEGYVEIEFLDAAGEVVEFVLAKPPVELGPGFVIPEEHRKLADEGKLTQAILLDMDTTAMLRLGTYPPAADAIMELVGFRGLPLKDKTPDGKQISLLAHQVQALTWLRQREAMDPAKNKGLRGGIAMLTQGLGKCHGKDTPILMWDGTIKMVQNIVDGDLICGDDSTPRTVLSTAFGRETMYRITPVKGDSYVVNESHILSLNISGNKTIYWSSGNNQWATRWLDHETLKYKSKLLGQDKIRAQKFVSKIFSPTTLDIPLVKYLSLSNAVRNRLMGYRADVDWPEKKVPLDPYILGAWLGDGSSNGAQITNTDPQIVEAFWNFSEENMYSMNRLKHDTISYGISGGFHNTLIDLNLRKNKHVPLCYKRNSQRVRLEVLAGLIDTDGSLVNDGCCYDIVQKKKILAEDICFLARSCGLAAYVKKCRKGCWYLGEYKEGTYYRVAISGDTDMIPVRIEYKKAQPRRQIKNVLVTGIKVEKLDEDWYYGFTLDGNHRYLLGDFTVTHNTLTALTLILTSPKGEFPSLVVASKTVMFEWRSQGVQKFFGNNIKVLYLHKDFMGKKHIDSLTRKDIVDYDIVITTYDVLVAVCRRDAYHKQTYEMGEDNTMMKGKKVAIHHRSRSQCNKPGVKGAGILFCTPWERVICDESQRFANPKTNVYECVMALYGEKMWCLTGTPIRNYDTDIWAQFRFCGYTGVTQALEWKRTSLAKYNQDRLNDAIFSMDYKDAKIVLPPKTEYIDLVMLTGNHKLFHDWVLGQTRLAYDSMMSGHLQFACVLAWFTALRQVTIAPYLFTANSKRNKATGKAKKYKDEIMAKIRKQFANSEMFKWLMDKTTDSGINSVKIKRIVDIISRIPPGEKVLVFSMFTSCTDLVADAVKAMLPDFEYVQVDGDVTGNDRSRLIEKFRKDPGVQGLFMTYKVGSEGLNLTEATHCICIEPWWTDAVHRQAKARCWRMGQTREVHVHNVYVQNTIEEKVTDICKAKNEMAAAFLEGTEKPLKKNVGLNKHTLGKILGIN